MSFFKDLVIEAIRIEYKLRRRKQLAKLGRYYRNKRLYGCGCCGGPPPAPLL